MKRSSLYDFYEGKWQTVNWRKAKRLYRYERRFYSKNTDRHGHRGYLAIVPGTKYAACTIYSPGLHEHYPIETQIRHIGDDPLSEFYDPADYPDLPASQVEDANARHRAPYRTRMAMSREVDFEFMSAIGKAEDVALKRIAISKARRRNSGNIVIDRVGGLMCTPDAPHGASHAHFVAALVADLMLARMRKDYALADAIKRDIVYGARSQVLIAKHGVEFILS